MELTVEHECPQCGAPIELDETARLIRCPYCNVKNFLFVRDYLRLLLPHKAPGKDIIYAPYMRFKGAAYLCRGTSISYRIVDITHQGTPLTQLPVSLGIRPQAMKMRFVTPDVNGTFLKYSLRPADVLAQVAGHTSLFGFGKLLHRAYIGEAFSFIYLPLFVQECRVFDAVINRPIGTSLQGKDIFRPFRDGDDRWRITFLATLCPRCGWNLDGEPDSVVLTCSNCDTAWEASEGTFAQVGLRAVPGQDKSAVYLPFWRITAREEVLQINSYADFIRVTGQPLVVQRQWENQDMSFWVPAFKIRPKVFLRLARQMTITQRDFVVKEKEDVPPKNVYPITLPKNEATQGMKVILASSAVTKRKIFPLLPHVNFAIEESTLVYVPFRDTGHEMIQERVGISINKNALKFGRYL